MEKYTTSRFKSVGFTLIELLVVISIIGVLSTISISSLNQARMKGRDARRLSDIRQLRTALELYYTDHGHYPPSCGSVAPNSSWTSSNSSSWNTDAPLCPSLSTSLSPYMSSLPHDPLEQTAVDGNSWAGLGTGNIWTGFYAYSYYDYQLNPQAYNGCGYDQYYVIVYRLEVAKGPDTGFVFCNGVTLWQYGGVGANTNIKTVGSKASQ